MESARGDVLLPNSLLDGFDPTGWWTAYAISHQWL